MPLGAPVTTLADGFDAPRPFEARYRLEIRGWPGATVRHTLSQESLHWTSDMRFSIAVAGGEERSRFAVEDDQIRSLLYSSSYSLLGVGDRYQLGEDELSHLDRQAAIVDLSRRAGRESCTQAAPCAIEFVDHRGRDEHFQYYDNDEVQRVSVPAGEFDTHSVILQDVDKPDRHLQIDFHPDWPGLILSAEYYKDGRRDTTLRLTQFDPSESASP
ncbi:hypothetical protein GEV37_07145 [Halomonas malpeensis]|uniref:DUF3108 domain-containing protein n=1 Tax=Vreelandella malpeensis TaxID=1172368 RepID=A0ABS8DSR1_9GAMM|nr:hypothetical protein [Halomonas malpeensis]